MSPQNCQSARNFKSSPLIQGVIIPSAVFAIQQEIDSKYIIVPLALARQLMEYDSTTVTSVEIRLAPGTEYNKIQSKLETLIGDQFDVKNRFQQQALLYRIMKSEKYIPDIDFYHNYCSI
ncbi:MAG: hypothetical protein R2759_17095 [Bacteroidales bacterium]